MYYTRLASLFFVASLQNSSLQNSRSLLSILLGCVILRVALEQTYNKAHFWVQSESSDFVPLGNFKTLPEKWPLSLFPRVRFWSSWKVTLGYNFGRIRDYDWILTKHQLAEKVNCAYVKRAVLPVGLFVHLSASFITPQRWGIYSHFHLKLKGGSQTQGEDDTRNFHFVECTRLEFLSVNHFSEHLRWMLWF